MSRHGWLPCFEQCRKEGRTTVHQLLCVGVELSTELLRLAHEGSEYILTDIETSPFRDDCFDAVLCIDVVEHLPS